MILLATFVALKIMALPFFTAGQKTRTNVPETQAASTASNSTPEGTKSKKKVPPIRFRTPEEIENDKNDTILNTTSEDSEEIDSPSEEAATIPTVTSETTSDEIFGEFIIPDHFDL